MKTPLFFLITLCFAFFGYSQTVELPETIISINADYLNSVEPENSCNYVKNLEDALVNYDHSELSELYDSKDDVYKVTFKLSEGQIIASFNKDGKIVKTYEKYNNIRLPQAVMQAIAEKYPNYSIIEDVYIVKFHCGANALKQEYRVKIKNDDAVLTVKTNKEGVFI